MLRDVAMSLCLSMLLQRFQNEQLIFINLTYNLFRSMKWRGLTKKSWACHYATRSMVAINKGPKSSSLTQKGKTDEYKSRFVGLNNLSNTCYMNSIIQQLFMIPSFRFSIMRAANPGNNIVLDQSKLIIAALLKLDTQSFSPRNFFNSITDMSGQPFNPAEQRDADEFFVRYIELLEEGLKDTKEGSIIKHLFEGKLTNQLICIDCPHRSERDEAFMTLSLHVKNKTHMNESLQSFVEPEILQGENAYSCEKCNMRKVSCVKRSCIKQLPNVLVTVLKRFEINYDTMSHIKVNSRLEFEKELDMKEFTYEHIEKQEIMKEMEDRNLSMDELDDKKLKILETQYPDDYYQYELKGIVIHMGEVDSGHYFSFIKDRDAFDSENWYEFNDSVVLPFDSDDMDDKAFGGENEILIDNDGIQEQIKAEKPSNAYMLVYERKKKYAWEEVDQKYELMLMDELGDTTPLYKDPLNNPQEYDKEEAKVHTEESDIEAFMKYRHSVSEHVSSRKDSTHYEIHIPKEFKDMIQHINMKECQLKYIFSTSSIDQIVSYLANITIIKVDKIESYQNVNLQGNLLEEDHQELEQEGDAVKNIEIIKFGIKYFLTVVLRSNSCRSKLISPMYNFIEISIKSNVAIAQFVVELFCYDHIITELLMTVPLITFESSIAGLLNLSLQVIYEHEHEHIEKYINAVYSGNDSDVVANLEAYLRINEDSTEDQNSWSLIESPSDQEAGSNKEHETEGEIEEEESENESIGKEQKNQGSPTDPNKLSDEDYRELYGKDRNSEQDSLMKLIGNDSEQQEKKNLKPLDSIDRLTEHELEMLLENIDKEDEEKPEKTLEEIVSTRRVYKYTYQD